MPHPSSRVKRSVEDESTQTPGSARWGFAHLRFSPCLPQGQGLCTLMTERLADALHVRDGTDIGLVLMYRYDVNDFSDDRLPNGNDAFEDSHTNRRKELGLSLKKKGRLRRDRRLRIPGQDLARHERPLLLEGILRRRTTAHSASGTRRRRYRSKATRRPRRIRSSSSRCLRRRSTKAAAPASTGCSSVRNTSSTSATTGARTCSATTTARHIGGRVAWTPRKGRGRRDPPRRRPRRARIATRRPTVSACATPERHDFDAARGGLDAGAAGQQRLAVGRRSCRSRRARRTVDRRAVVGAGRSDPRRRLAQRRESGLLRERLLRIRQLGRSPAKAGRTATETSATSSRRAPGARGSCCCATASSISTTDPCRAARSTTGRSARTGI